MSIVSYAMRVSESGQQPRSFKDDGDKALAAMPALFSLVHASVVFWLVPTSPLPIQG
jgi:hypothetical protein